MSRWNNLPFHPEIISRWLQNVLKLYWVILEGLTVRSMFCKTVRKNPEPIVFKCYLHNIKHSFELFFYIF